MHPGAVAYGISSTRKIFFYWGYIYKGGGGERAHPSLKHRTLEWQWGSRNTEIPEHSATVHCRHRDYMVQ